MKTTRSIFQFPRISMTEMDREKNVICMSLSSDPDLNLALEEYLLNTISWDQEIVFLYENKPLVVVGRFQNPWKECRTGLARRSGLLLRRRISGGGTVVHGPGNLNWSVISGRKQPCKEANLNRIIEALAELGIIAQCNERHDLIVETDRQQRKISGSAFRQISGGSLHHATLLVNANLDVLCDVLRVPERHISASGVASRPFPVINLCNIDSTLNVEKIASRISQIWERAGYVPVTIDPRDFVGQKAFDESRHRLASDEWNWGRTPAFSEIFTPIPGMPCCALEIRVSAGHIESLHIRSEKAHTAEKTKNRCENRHKIQAEFLNRIVSCPFHGHDILDRLVPETQGNHQDRFSSLITFLAKQIDGDGHPDCPIASDVL